MPIDPTLSLKVQVPQIEDPLQQYGRMMNLRDLMDQRRVRDLQVRRLELQEQEAQREEAERQAFKAALARGAKPEELIAANPELGIRYATNLATMQSQQRLAQDAELTRRRKINQDIASLGISAVQIADPLERAKYHAAGIASLIDQGALKPEEFGKYRIPADQREAEMQFGSAYGPEKLQQVRTAIATEARNREEEARKAALFPEQYALAQANKTAAQNRTLGLEPEQPHQKAMRELAEKLDTPEKIALELQTNTKLTPARRAQLLAAQAEMIRLRKEAQLLSPEREAQQIRISAANRPAVADLGDPANWADRIARGQAQLSSVPQAIRGKVVDALGSAQIISPKQREQFAGLDQVEALVDQIEKYSRAVNTKFGLNALTAGALQNALARIQNAPEVQGLQRQTAFLGTLARQLGGNVGALSDPDIARAIQSIPLVGDSDQVAAGKLADLRNILNSRRNSLLGQAGTVYRQPEGGGQIVPERGGAAPSAPGAAPKKRRIWNEKTSTFEEK